MPNERKTQNEMTEIREAIIMNHEYRDGSDESVS
jgi:hypothetical protein